MFGWLSEPAIRDSRRNRSANASSCECRERELLERDEPVEVGLAREVDRRHAAAADLLEDLVATDPLQDQRHRRLPRW